MKRRKLMLAAALMLSSLSLTVGNEAKAERITVGGEEVRTLTDVTLSGNDTPSVNGSAIYNSGKLIIEGNSSIESNNSKYGAIYNAGVMNVTATVEGNKGSYGGAIYTEKELTAGGTFKKNIASMRGGAIYSEGVNKDNISITKISESSIFEENKANSGGAIMSTFYSDLEVGSNTQFKGNKATNGTGGAIALIKNKYYRGSVNKIGSEVKFIGNEATKDGGAINIGNYVTNRVEIGEKSYFERNISGDEGGAIYNQGSNLTLGDGAEFKLNSAKYGGAIYQKADTDLTITKAAFSENSAIGGKDNKGNKTSSGGALFIAKTNKQSITIKKSTFNKNTSDVAGGAILQENTSTASINISDNSTFTENTTYAEGGAIVADSVLNITDSTFSKNATTSTRVGDDIYTNDDGGGAIMLYDNGKATITGSTFTENTSGTYGGAIGTRTGASSDNSSITVNTSTFTSNEAKANGGAIAANVNATITDTDFISNTAGQKGGAIYSAANVTTQINAKTKDVEFTGNTANGVSNAIYSNDGILKFAAESGKNIILNDSIAGNSSLIKSGEGSLVLNNAMSDYTGNVQIDSGTVKLGEDGTYFATTSTTVKGGMLDLRNTKTQAIDLGAVTLNSDLNTAVDFNLSSEEIDNFNADSVAGTGKISLTDINISLLEDADKLKVEAKVTDDVLKDSFNFATNTSVETGDSVDFDGNSSFPWYITYESKDDGGYLIFDRADQNLKKAANALDTERIYTLGRNEIVNEDINEMNGGKLIVSGNNKDIIASGQSGIYTTDAAQELSVNNVNNITGFNSENGGFVDNTKGAKVNLLNVKTSGNEASSNGGVISNAGDVIIENSSLNDNAAKNGGAIYNTANTTLIDTSFENNKSSSNGGAIYNAANASLNIVADKNDISFEGNTANGASNAIHNEGTANLNAGSSIALNDSITGDGVLNINTALNYTDASGNAKTAPTDGTVILNNDMSGYKGTVNIAGGTIKVGENGTMLNAVNTNITGGNFDLINNKLDNADLGTVDVASNPNLDIDFDLSQIKSDSFNGTFTGDGKFNVNKINVYGNTLENYIHVHLSDLTGIDRNHLTSVNQSLPTVLTPIRYLAGSVSDDYLTYQPTGESYNDFNPAVMASSVAAQVGGYLTQLNSYDEAFRNMDMYMLMTKKERQALKNANKYAAGDSNLVFNNVDTPYTDKAGWFRPYATFESVGLKNGPKVSNVSYGSYAGIESEMYELGNGWDGLISLYAGYNGSHQAYQGNSIYQNGGTLGLVGMAYKDNFFTGLTVNAGANVGEANTMYGNEDFTMFMTGIASKSGYNFELADGKFIIQPNYMMAYSMVNTFDYTNAAGVRINSDPLHAITLAPGVKFIGNLNNGWQPYAGVNVIWNIMDKTQFKANDVTLPELSVKPYVMYGVGVRKTWGQRFTGFIQAFLTNGGRNGVGLQTGLRWTLGKDPAKYNNATGEKKYVKAKA